MYELQIKDGHKCITKYTKYIKIKHKILVWEDSLKYEIQVIWNSKNKKETFYANWYFYILAI